MGFEFSDSIKRGGASCCEVVYMGCEFEIIVKYCEGIIIATNEPLRQKPFKYPKLRQISVQVANARQIAVRIAKITSNNHSNTRHHVKNSRSNSNIES